MTAILTVLLVCYFFPSVVALLRGHSSAMAILVLNIFLGWTFLGWVISLVWACTGDGARSVDVRLIAPVDALPLPPPRDWTERLDDYCFKHFGWR